MSEIRNSGISRIITGCTTAIVTVGEAIVAAGNSLVANRAAVLEFARQTDLFTRRPATLPPLATCLVRHETMLVLEEKVHDVLTAENDATLTRAQHDLEQLVLHEQCAILYEHLAPRIAQTTAATGFTNVRVLPMPDSVLLIGENDRGQALQHELTALQGQPLALRSETLGFYDGACTEVLDQFTHELHNQGITLAPESTISTLRRRQTRHQTIRRQR